MNNEQVRFIPVTKENLRYIRTNFFHFTLAQVALSCQMSITSVRNAEIGLGVSDDKVNRLYDFYLKCNQIRRKLRQEKTTKAGI